MGRGGIKAMKEVTVQGNYSPRRNSENNGNATKTFLSQYGKLCWFLTRLHFSTHAHTRG